MSEAGGRHEKWLFVRSIPDRILGGGGEGEGEGRRTKGCLGGEKGGGCGTERCRGVRLGGEREEGETGKDE